MNTFLPKIKYFFIGLLLSHPLAVAQDLASVAEVAFTDTNHTFTVISGYSEVAAKVADLSSAPVSVLTDWDDTVNAPGAWHQKFYDGSWVCPTTKRMLLESEVDGMLRDSDTVSIIQSWKTDSIPVLVTTARPPVIDAKLTKYAANRNLHKNLMDARTTTNPDQIDYDTIKAISLNIFRELGRTTLTEKVAKKITAMSLQSGIDLRGQENLMHTVIEDHNNHMLVYQDGYAFIGHDKGPNMLHLVSEIGLTPGHLVIIDDSSRALISYLDTGIVAGFEELGYTLHLLHYPVEKK